MRILIENYRGWGILFDTDSEEFYSFSDQYDREEKKRSYSAAKKYVDEFIKSNFKFEPFWVEGMPYGYKSNKIKIVGIRKDNRFVYEKKDGVEQISEYEEKDYFLIDTSNEIVFAEIKQCVDRKSELDAKIKDLESKVKKVTLQSVKPKYIQP